MTTRYVNDAVARLVTTQLSCVITALYVNAAAGPFSYDAVAL